MPPPWDILPAGTCEQVLFLAASVCLATQNLENYWSEIDVTWSEYVPGWMLEVIGSWWHLTLTSDLESYFLIFQLSLYRYSDRTSWEIQRVVLTVLNSFSRQSILVSTNVTSALEVFLNNMRHINSRFTYLLTYLLDLATSFSMCGYI